MKWIKTSYELFKTVQTAEIKEQLRGHNQDADDRDIFKHYILPHFESSFDELQGKNMRRKRKKIDP